MTARRKGFCVVDACLFNLRMGLAFLLRDEDEILNRRVQEEQMYGAWLMVAIFAGLSLTTTRAFNMILLIVGFSQLYFLALLFSTDQRTRSLVS